MTTTINCYWTHTNDATPLQRLTQGEADFPVVDRAATAVEEALLQTGLTKGLSLMVADRYGEERPLTLFAADTREFTPDVAAEIRLTAAAARELRATTEDALYAALAKPMGEVTAAVGKIRLAGESFDALNYHTSYRIEERARVLGISSDLLAQVTARLVAEAAGVGLARQKKQDEDRAAAVKAGDDEVKAAIAEGKEEIGGGGIEWYARYNGSPEMLVAATTYMDARRAGQKAREQAERDEWLAAVTCHLSAEQVERLGAGALSDDEITETVRDAVLPSSLAGLDEYDLLDHDDLEGGEEYCEHEEMSCKTTDQTTYTAEQWTAKKALAVTLPQGSTLTLTRHRCTCDAQNCDAEAERFSLLARVAVGPRHVSRRYRV